MHHFVRLIEGIVDTAFIFIEKFLGALFSWIFPHGLPKKKSGYGATFGDPKHILKRVHKGFCLTGQRSLSVKDSYTNTILVGATGSGKSSVVFIPSLLRMNSSFIVHDPSGELAQLATPCLIRRGYTIKTLNFADPEKSDHYNPLYRANSTSEINKVASLVIRTTLGGVKGDPFWNLQATALLSLLITLVKGEDRDRQNFRHVRHYLNQLSSDDAFITRKIAGVNDLTLRAEFGTFQAYDDKVKAGIIATVSSALHIFTDDAVAEVTSHDTLSLPDMRLKRTALFIQNPVTDQAYYAMLSSLFFEQLFGELLSRLPQPWHHDVFCLIDETGVLYLPSLGNVIANIRKYRAGIMAGVQSLAQLYHLYGHHEARTIINNCFAKMYFTGQSGAMAEELEQTLGRYQYDDDKGRTHIRPLITRDEIRTLKRNQALLIAGNHPAILLKLTPYYQQRGLVALTKLPRNHS